MGTFLISFRIGCINRIITLLCFRWWLSRSGTRGACVVILAYCFFLCGFLNFRSWLRNPINTRNLQKKRLIECQVSHGEIKWTFNRCTQERGQYVTLSWSLFTFWFTSSDVKMGASKTEVLEKNKDNQHKHYLEPPALRHQISHGFALKGKEPIKVQTVLNSWNMVKIAINNRILWEKVHHITYNLDFGGKKLSLLFYIDNCSGKGQICPVLYSDWIVIPSQWFYFCSKM